MMKKNKVFVACDSTNILKIKKIIRDTQNTKLKVGYKFGLEFLNSKYGRSFLSKIKNFSPGISALKIAQNRILEKELARGLSIPVPKYWIVKSKEDLSTAKDKLMTINDEYGETVDQILTESYGGTESD